MTRNHSQEAWRFGNRLQISLVWFGVNEGSGRNLGVTKGFGASIFRSLHQSLL
jgi:hypothetical protein